MPPLPMPHRPPIRGRRSSSDMLRDPPNRARQWEGSTGVDVAAVGPCCISTTANEDADRVVRHDRIAAAGRVELAAPPCVSSHHRLMIDRNEQNHEIVNRCLNDPAFQSAAFKAIVKQIYSEIRTEHDVAQNCATL